MRIDPRTAPAAAPRGNALVIQLVILVVVAGTIALPLVLVARAKTARKTRLLEAIVTLVNESNAVKEELVRAFDQVGAAIRRLPHAERLKRDYADEFTELFHRYYSAHKGVDRGDDRPTAEDLLALKRDFEDFKRRLDNQRERIRALEEIAAIAERAVVLARHYQAGVRLVRDHAPFGPNRYILPQLEEADRQLGTALSFVLAGLDRFQEDLRGTDTPILIKTGIEQVRRIIRDVDALLADVEGAAEVRISQPGLGELTLADYLARFAEESRRTELPPLPAAPVQAAPGRGPPAGPP